MHQQHNCWCMCKILWWYDIYIWMYTQNIITKKKKIVLLKQCLLIAKFIELLTIPNDIYIQNVYSLKRIYRGVGFVTVISFLMLSSNIDKITGLQACSQTSTYPREFPTLITPLWFCKQWGKLAFQWHHMSIVASQYTSNSAVCWTVCLCLDQRKYQCPLEGLL